MSNSPTVVELVQQLAAAERSVRAREPLRLSRPAQELRKDFRRFSELRDELSRAEPRVLALRDAAQLLTDDAQDVCRRSVPHNANIMFVCAEKFEIMWLCF